MWILRTIVLVAAVAAITSVFPRRRLAAAHTAAMAAGEDLGYRDARADRSALGRDLARTAVAQQRRSSQPF